MDVLAADLDGGEKALTVFSFAEEADAKVSVIMDKVRAVSLRNKQSREI